MAIRNRITDLLGVQYPIIQAPMGWIARSQLASAVCEAGGLGVIETSSGDLDAVRQEIKTLRTLTDKPFGVNIAQAFVRDPDIVSFVVDQGVKFVTTSAGDPRRYCEQLKSAGLTVFHVVPSLDAAMKALAAGVDGLVVEGVTGPAAEAGIRQGDVLLAFNGEKVTSVDQLRQLVGKAKGKAAVLVQREDARLYIPIKIG